MKLYLVQHGEAKTKEEDPDRALTNTGKELSEKTACFLLNRLGSLLMLFFTVAK